MHRNAEIVRRAYAAFNAADIQTLTETFDEKASWHTPGSSAIAGSTKDREATFAQFGRYLEGTGGTFKAELRYVAADDEGRVVGVHYNSGTRNGAWVRPHASAQWARAGTHRQSPSRGWAFGISS